MLFIFATALFSLFNGLNAQAVDANGITLYEKLEVMERQILNPGTLIFDVLPCSANQFDDPNRGEQTSAEWVRIVFHDFITANVAGPGLGGLDASIGFESDRAENIGIFVNVTLAQLSLFSSVFLSMADLINVGIADALASCDPAVRRLPLRVGRIDATGPGPAGVPGPGDSLAVAQAAFAKAGFTQSQMIQAVACGHSLGGVHHSNFPNIVTSQFSTFGTDGRASFDSTPGVFDNTGVQEYITNTGLKGGPLVIGPVATRSDFRIFNSDGNATINAMSSATSFENTCFTIFEKMVNTVPSAVTLSDPIVPRPWFLRESHLDLNSAGAVTFSGKIAGHSTSTMPNTAAYNYSTVGGGNTGPKTSQAGTLLTPAGIGYGNIEDYPFSDVLNSPTINAINVQGSYTSPINQNIFILPSQSKRNVITNSLNQQAATQYVVRAAILTSLAPSGTILTAKLWYPDNQPGTVVPKIRLLTAPMSVKTTLGAYTIYQAVMTSGDGINQIPSGAPFFQVVLGTTQASAKVSPFDPTTWPSCTTVPLTNC